VHHALGIQKQRLGWRCVVVALVAVAVAEMVVLEAALVGMREDLKAA
jgi:hypothetical protein